MLGAMTCGRHSGGGFGPGAALSLMLVVLQWPAPATADPRDWAEDATRIYFNREAGLRWQSEGGDWLDRAATLRGEIPLAVVDVPPPKVPGWLEWDVTAIVRDWMAGAYPHRGFLLRAIGPSNALNLESRESAATQRRPQLLLETGDSEQRLQAVADTYLHSSTTRSLGTDVRLKLDAGGAVLVRFALPRTSPSALRRATLRLYASKQFGASRIGVYRARPTPESGVATPRLGTAGIYPRDRGIDSDPQVIFVEDFESPRWKDRWVDGTGSYTVLDADSERRFEALQGRALRVTLEMGKALGLNMSYLFAEQAGKEPVAVYLRYYLRFGSDWGTSSVGGKLPGIAGTYGVAGWGGRRPDGSNGWSARGAFAPFPSRDNPAAERTSVGFYVYHLDQYDAYGNVFMWPRDGLGLIPNGEWRCIEQYVKLNTPGQSDGELRGWVDGRLAFERTGFRFRTVDSVRIDRIWLNVYHGGTEPSPARQTLYIDNLVVAESYVGPMVDDEGRVVVARR
jgi:hypothetical protein